MSPDRWFVVAAALLMSWVLLQFTCPDCRAFPAAQEGERNYHVFYQLCGSASGRAEFGLQDPSAYRYLSQARCIDVPGMDDAQDYDEVTRSLDALGFSPSETHAVFELVSAVLLLGEFEFHALRQGSELASRNAATQPAALLGVDAGDLAAAVCKKTSMAGRREAFEQLLDPVAAQACTDALAKAIYGRLFDWLVTRINQAVAVQAPGRGAGAAAGAGAGARGRAAPPPSAISSLPFIGVLDIFGFEIFESNSFEQVRRDVWVCASVCACAVWLGVTS